MKRPSHIDPSMIKDLKQELRAKFIQTVSLIISNPSSVFGYEYDIQSIMEEIRMSLDDYLRLILTSLSRQVRTSEELLLIHGYLFFMKDFTSMLLKVDKKSFNETLRTIASHLGYDHIEKDKVLFRFGDKGRKAFIILKGSISILISKSVKMKVYAGDYIRYIANLLRYKEYGLVNQALNENYPIFPVEIIEPPDDNTGSFESNSKKYQRKKSRILAKSLIDGGGSGAGAGGANGEGTNVTEEKITLFKLDQRNLSIKTLMESKAKLFTVDELLSIYDKEKKWREIGFASNANTEDYVKRINILQPLSDHSLLMNKEVIEVKVFSYVNILTLGTGSFFGELALRNPNALRTASIITNSECFFGTLNINTYNTSLKAGAEKQRRQNVNFILSMQIFSSINHHIFQKKHFNNFTLGKCEKGTFLLNELERSQWIFLLKEGSFEVTLKASLHDLTQLLKYHYTKSPEGAIELNRLENDERNTMHLLLENKKLEKSYNEKKLFRITEVTPPEVAGLSDYLNDKGLNAFSLECKSPKGEYYQISNYFYADMMQRDNNIKLNEISYLNKKYLFLTKRLLTIRKSTLMLMCGHRTTLLNEVIGQELEEESLRIAAMKRMFDFKKMHCESKALRLRLQTSSNWNANNTGMFKQRMNTEANIPIALHYKNKDKGKDNDSNPILFNQSLRNAVLTPLNNHRPKASQSFNNNPITTNDSSIRLNFRNRNGDKDNEYYKHKEMTKDNTDIEDDQMLMKIIPFANKKEKVMKKSFNGRIEITRESNYFTQRDKSLDYPLCTNNPLSITNRNKLLWKKKSLILPNKFNLTEMIWENVKSSALLPVCVTETSDPITHENAINTNKSNLQRDNLNERMRKKMKKEKDTQKQRKVNHKTVFLMRMSTKEKDIVDIGRYTQMKLENYIEKRNSYLSRDYTRVNYKIGGKIK